MPRLPVKPESEAARKLREKLTSKFQAKHRAGPIHFFEMGLIGDPELQNEAFCVEALYCTLMTPENVIAFRAYCQAIKYADKHHYLKHWYENAFYEATHRIEKALKESDERQALISVLTGNGNDGSEGT